MLTGIHFLLTYTCNLECDHCFVYSSPRAKGTFTLNQIKKIFTEINKIKSVEWIFFEGGEPFLYYPIMLEGIKMARNFGYKTGIVTNAYWATSEEDAGLWLGPLAELNVSDVSISDDAFHTENEKDNLAGKALIAGKMLGMNADSICIEKPTKKQRDNENVVIKGIPVTGSGAMFRGRAVEKLVKGLSTKDWKSFNLCPYEDLRDPKRVHIDYSGSVHICQGLSMGNMWTTPLSKLVSNYDAERHPVCGPLARGGPALLADRYKVKHNVKYVDACHFCYCIRKSLIDRFPQFLGPRQIYGMA